MDTTVNVDEEDKQDMHDFHVLLGLEGSNDEKKIETSGNLKEGKRGWHANDSSLHIYMHYNHWSGSHRCGICNEKEKKILQGKTK